MYIPKFSGEKIILVEAIIFSLFAVLSKLVLNELSTIVVIIITWAFAGALFAAILTYKKQWSSLTKHPDQYVNILLAGFIIGVVAHGLMFYGISMTTAGNAALIGVTEVLFSYLFFSVWKKEKEKFLHMLGAIFMMLGVGIAFWESLVSFEWNAGDLWVMLGFALCPLGNFFQQKAGKSDLPNEMILLVRTLLILLVFIPIFFLYSEMPSYSEISENFLALFGIGFFILGVSKLLWIRGISLVSVPKAISISSVYPLFSFVFAYFLLQEIPSWYQITAMIPMGIGIFLLMKR